MWSGGVINVVLLCVLSAFEASGQTLREETLATSVRRILTSDDQAVGLRGRGLADQAVGLPGLRGRGLRRRRRRRPVDVLIIVDSSASVRAEGFEDAKRSAQLLVSMIDSVTPISSQGTRIGFIKYSAADKTSVEFRFGRYNDASSVRRAIGRIRFDNGGATATSLALAYAINEYLNNGIGRKEVIWLFTDGRANAEGDPVKTATHLKDIMGVKICVVGIGSYVDPTELNGMASGRCIHRYPSYAALRQAMGIAAQQISQTTPRPRPRRGRFQPRDTGVIRPRIVDPGWQDIIRDPMLSPAGVSDRRVRRLPGISTRRFSFPRGGILPRRTRLQSLPMIF